jgi:hypothetical protein
VQFLQPAEHRSVTFETRVVGLQQFALAMPMDLSVKYEAMFKRGMDGFSCFRGSRISKSMFLLQTSLSRISSASTTLQDTSQIL